MSACKMHAPSYAFREQMRGALWHAACHVDACIQGSPLQTSQVTGSRNSIPAGSPGVRAAALSKHRRGGWTAYYQPAVKSADESSAVILLLPRLQAPHPLSIVTWLKHAPSPQRDLSAPALEDL